MTMKIHRFFAGATVATVLTIANPVYAGLLGGNATGAVNGTLSGQMGDIGGAANGRVTGSIDAQTDAVSRVGRRTRDIGERTTDHVKDGVGKARDRAKSTVDSARDTTADASASAATTASGAANSGVATANNGVDAASSADTSVSESVGASKSVEAGDRTVDGMTETSAQGSAAARQDADSLELMGEGSAQSATQVKAGRKAAEPAPATEPAVDRNDRR
jgi:hypothetical protein